MRHAKKKVTLGRKRNPRRALLRNLAESVIVHERMTTTRAKARAVRPIVERLVTKAKTGTLANRRLVQKTLFTERAVKKLMEDLAPRYKSRPGGYLRIIRLPSRSSDRSEQVRIEFV
ncbi:MAG: 50S ribosomal protein L17 [Patescibacteria group bacterium]